MAEVLLFHHAQGRTAGVDAFAEELRRAGHVVHVPDLFDGRIFATVQEGVAHAGSIGFGEVLERGVREADPLPAELVYAGFSLGVMPAQKLAQTRAGARGALLFHACLPTSEFGSDWPADVPVQIHGMEADPFFADEGDLDALGLWWRRPQTRNCSSTPGTSTCSPTAACRRTSRTPPPSSPGGCSTSWPIAEGT